MSRYGLVEQLTSIIKLLTDFPQGLEILLGNVPPPSCEDINVMLESVRPPIEPTRDSAGMPLRVDGGKVIFAPDQMIDSEERYNRVVVHVGGWAHINEVTRGWRTVFPQRWKILSDYLVWVGASSTRIDTSRLDKVASKHLVSRDSVLHIAQIFPQELSIAILKAPVGDEFQLLTDKNLEAV
jgi:hypothetical protein